ncbi:perilipin-3 [Pogona vitticeps]
MASDVKGKSSEAPRTESVVTRVASLPLVTSTYDLLSSVYAYAKENYPCINTACNVAEMVASMAVGSAKGGVQPLVGHLEPQIAAMNEYACKGLDTLEERVPCLHQPAHQVIEEGVTLAKSVVGSTVHTAMDAANGAKHLFTHRVTAAVDLTKDIVQDSVALTKMVVNSTVNTALSAANEAKTLVSHRVTDVVNLSKETAQESVDLTKAVVSSTVNTALQAAAGTKDLLVTGQVKNCGAAQEGIEMGSFIQQWVATGVDAVLEKTEEMIDYYLPMTEEELVKLATEVQGFGPPSLEDQRRQQSYFVRLGSLSSKVRQRASLHSLSRLNLIKENTQNTLSQLQRVINLVEHLKEGVGQQFQEAQLKLHQLVAEWTGTQPGDASVGDTPPEVESRTLAMLRVVTQDLGPAYLRLVGGIEGLPVSLREKVDHAVSNARQLHASFSAAGSLRDLSSDLLAQSREKIAQAREVLEALVRYMTESTPLNWIIGPFRPSPAAPEEGEMETPQPGGQEGKEGAEPGDETSLSEMILKETKAEQRSAKEEEKKGEGSEAKETLEGLVATWSDMPKKARKRVLKEATKEGSGQKPSKSALNQVPESHKQQ